ncbi:MAG: hypothetical protein K2H19_05155, partial [Ruminococcus sp.]|nr:hypothetical protein [Ruminococcus sp.]
MDLHEIFLASQIAGKSNGGGENVDLSDYYTKSQISNILSDKVDKVSGMGLSTNDFTNAAKSKLDNLSNYDDTDVKADIANMVEQTALNRSTLGYQSKNLLKNTATTQTKSGVTFTVNSDGSIVANGTATEDVYIIILSFSKSFLSDGQYIYSGCTGGSYKTYYLRYVNQGKVQDSYNGDKVITHTTQGSGNFSVMIMKNTTVNNQIFYPMLRRKEITDDTYEPYKPSVMEHFENKVDKVSGKGLSTNDFTNALKTKLDSLENYDDTQIKSEISTLSNKKYLDEQSIPSGADLNDYISENFQVYCT